LITRRRIDMDRRKTRKLDRREAQLGASLDSLAHRYRELMMKFPTGEEDEPLPPEKVVSMSQEARELARLALSASEELAGLACEMRGEDEPYPWPRDYNAEEDPEEGAECPCRERFGD
jgi:hypothetical protein